MPPFNFDGRQATDAGYRFRLFFEKYLGTFEKIYGGQVPRLTDEEIANVYEVSLHT